MNKAQDILNRLNSLDEDKRVEAKCGSKIDRSDGCTTPNILKTTELFKRGRKKKITFTSKITQGRLRCLGCLSS